MAKAKQNAIDFPFYRIMWQFYLSNKKEIRKSYTNLTRTILANAEPSKDNPTSFLRKPQYEAFEMYVFLKEYLGNPRLAESVFINWNYDGVTFCPETTTSRKRTSLWRGIDYLQKIHYILV